MDPSPASVSFPPATLPASTPFSFRKRPVVIVAMRWDGSIASAVKIRNAFGVSVEVHAEDGDRCAPRLACKTLEGTLFATAGDWIIRGIQNEVYPCKPDIFAATYEVVDVPPPDVGAGPW